MALTTFDTNNALTKKVWEEKLFRETLPETYFNRFMGEGADNVVHVKTDLQKDQGDKITYGLIARLLGAGVQGDTQLKGNEESLATYDDTVILDQYRHAVASRGRMSRRRPAFSIPDEARTALKQWGAEKIDKLCFNALTATPSFVAYKDGAAGAFSKTTTAATAKAALSAANSKLTLGFFGYLRTLARTGNDRQFTPIRPIKIKGREWYVLLCHEDVLFDIKQDTNFQQAQRECQERADDHPLFVGATAVYDQVVVHAHEFMPKASDGGGGSIDWAQCVLMGAQALCWAWGMRPQMDQETDDYGNQLGWAWSIISGVKKPVFNSIDYGSIGVYLARTKVSG
jgi:N4-gp56 family major capsid protein